MGRDILSVRQIMILLMVGLLAPATELLPVVAARQVGGGGWLVGLGMLPVLLFALWIGSNVFCGDGVCLCAGKPMGYNIIIIYLGWIVLTLSAALRLSAARMELIYGQPSSVWISVILLAVAVWMGMGKASALARAAEIFYLALAVLLTGVLLLAAFKVEWRNLYPVEWRGLPKGSLLSAGMLLNAAPIAVLGARVPMKMRSGRRACGWAVVFCVAIVLTLAVVLGNLGSKLSARLDIPYIIMVQGLSIKGAFQRTEALIAAVWLLSDLVLCGVLLQSWKNCAARIVSEKWGRRSIPVVGAAVVIGGWLLPLSGGEVREMCLRWLPITGVALGIVFPGLILLFFGTKRKRRG